MASPTVAAPLAPPARQVGRRGAVWAQWCGPAALLFAVPYLIALALERYRLHDAGLEALGTSLLDPKWHNIAECAAAAACVAAGLVFPAFRVAVLRRAECAFTQFANHRIQALLCVGALPLIVRLALLPVLGVP